MSACFGFILRLRINQRSVCVTSSVLVHFGPCDPGVPVVTALLRYASSTGLLYGAIYPVGCEGSNDYNAYRPAHMSLEPAFTGIRGLETISPRLQVRHSQA